MVKYNDGQKKYQIKWVVTNDYIFRCPDFLEALILVIKMFECFISADPTFRVQSAPAKIGEVSSKVGLSKELTTMSSVAKMECKMK